MKKNKRKKIEKLGLIYDEITKFIEWNQAYFNFIILLKIEKKVYR